MSFIYDDPNLIDNLLKSALDFQVKFTKQGQAAAAAVNNDKVNLDTLLNNLQNPVSGSGISYEGDAAPRYDDSSLENLGALVSFLAMNKITVGGKRAAYMANEATPELEANQDYHYYKLEGNAGLVEVQDRTKITNGYFVNKNLLVKFIQSRQAKLATKPNKTEEVQLGALIEQANDLLDTNIDPKFNPNTIDLESNVDSLPVTLDEANMYDVSGKLILKLKDLQSPESLNDWLNENKINVKANGKDIPVTDPAFDRCVVVRYLHGRAKWKAGGAGTKDKAVYGAYLQAVQTVGIKVTGADGKPCKLSGVSNTTPGAVTSDALQSIVNSLPLDIKDIDFNRIKRFFTTYKQYISDENEANGHMDRAIQIMDATTQMTNPPTSDFSMEMDQNTILSLLKAAPVSQYTQFLSQLEMVVDSTARVVGIFYNAHVRQAYSGEKKPIETLTATQREEVYNQFMGPSSALARNKSKLQQLMRYQPGKVK